MPKKYKRQFYEKTCPACKGLTYIEHEHGLIRLRCERCKGTGKVRKERRVFPPEKESKNESQTV